MMGSSVMLPRFSKIEDQQRNFENFIQMFKDWCELNGRYDSGPPAEATKEGADSSSAFLLILHVAAANIYRQPF